MKDFAAKLAYVQSLHVHQSSHPTPSHPELYDLAYPESIAETKAQTMHIFWA